MLIRAYVDEYYRIHIDPTVTINSENENDYRVQFIFQQPWGDEFTLYGVFKPVNDIPVSFRCDENNQVTIPNLYYGRYKRLGIALRGVAYAHTNIGDTQTASVSFTKDSFVKNEMGEYVCTLSKATLDLSSPQLLSICIYTDEQQTILEPIDYFVKYTPQNIIITLNVPLDTYESYNGSFNFISIGNSGSATNTGNRQQIVRTTDYFYVPVVMGAMQ